LRGVNSYCEPMSVKDDEMSPTEQLGLRLPSDIVAWLRRRGKEDQRSMAFIAAQAIREAMAREAATKKRKGKTTI
jgi:uncharacterized protein (DUF4415 family)